MAGLYPPAASEPKATQNPGNSQSPACAIILPARGNTNGTNLVIWRVYSLDLRRTHELLVIRHATTPHGRLIDRRRTQYQDISEQRKSCADGQI
ncbi:MAG: hypothetical protein ACLP8B_10085 [Xanthobacteraceae bacterium]